MPSHVFKIDQGKFGLSVVNPAASGYQASWQAPGGKTATTAKIADYTSGGLGDFTCQITSGALTSSPNTTDETTPATFCGPEETTTNVGVTSYTLDTAFLQDPDLVNGLNRFLFENDTDEAYFLLALANDIPPKAIGRCRLISGTIGGDARTVLTATLSLPCSRKPDVAFGATDVGSVIIAGSASGAGTSTSATAGAPGSFNGVPPANLAATTGITANPNTAWSAGSFVILGDNTHAHWSGSAWVVGP